MTVRNNTPQRRVELTDSGGNALKIDDVTYALTIISYEHHEIHEGDSFVVSYAVDLGNGAVIDIQLQTPNSTKLCHAIFNVISEAEAQLDIYEGPTTTGGTGLTEVNRNRASSTVATLVAVHTPSVSNAGTLIFTKHWGAGKTSGAESRDSNEFVLAANTKYLVRVTNATTSANFVSIWVDWYEH